MDAKNWQLRQVVSKSLRAPAKSTDYIKEYEAECRSSFWYDVADVIEDIYKHSLSGQELRRWLNIGLDRFLVKEFLSYGSGCELAGCDALTPQTLKWREGAGFLIKQQVPNSIAGMASESDPENWCPDPLRTALLRVYLTNIDIYHFTPEDVKRDRVLAAIAEGRLNLDPLGFNSPRLVELVDAYFLYRLVELECECGQDC